MSDSIKVAIKVRPLIKREKDDNLPIQWVVHGNSIVSTDTELKKRGDGGFCFDHIFDINASNSDVFDSIVKPIVDAAVNGFNGTVFAYGQTSSGKTYTMMGTLNEPGIIPLAIEHMFDAITNSAGREFLLRVSYLEIYKEKVNDLLNRTGTDLKLKEDSSGQVILQCKEEITNCPENMLCIMKKGDKYRRTGETNMNERSSRSHTIFRITIESREVGGDSDSAIQVSQLNLVDLAGSERARQTGATGERFKEGLHINLSLSTLGLVIMQLSECQDGQKYVNFRDSKLTRLLQNSLGGNAMTAIICAVTPAAVDETQCTLSFACRAKSVKNKPHINEVMSDAALLKRYAKQISKLQTELEKIKTENRVAEVEEMESKLQEKERVNQMLEERIGLLKTRIVSGDIASDDSFRCKSKRRQTWGGPGMFKHVEAFQPTPGLPTIKEMSRERSCRKSIIQSDDIDLMNQTFQTAFTDFELELFKSERDREDEENGTDSDDEPTITRRVTFRDDVYTIKSKDSIIPEKISISPEKCNSATQTVNCQTSPSTPKQVLRRRINYLTNEFKELCEFTTLEKQLLGNGDGSKKYTPEVKKLLGSLNLTEETNVNHVIAELCRKLGKLEQENILEKEASRKTMKRFSQLEMQIKNITSERDEFQYMSGELRVELKKKTTELELKNMSEESVKEEELKKILELERKLKDITLQNTELRAESTKKITELQKEIENIVSERKEFELIRRELCMQLNNKSLELEKMKNNPKISNQEVATNLRELEKKTEEISFEKAALEQVVVDLRAELNQVSSDAELRLVLERTAHAETLEKVCQLQKQVADLTSKRDEIQHVNVDLKAQLESKIAVEQAATQETIKKGYELKEQEMIDKLSVLERKVESVTSERNELKEKMQLKEAEYQKMMEKVNNLKNQVEVVANQSVEFERVNAELRQNISDLENKADEQMKAISELESKARDLTSKKEDLYRIIAEKDEENSKLESIAEERIRAIETINLEKEELEHVNTELRQNISDLEIKAVEQMKAISELEGKVCGLASEKEELHRIIVEKNVESSKLESIAEERIRAVETINLEKEELEHVNAELRQNIFNLETKAVEQVKAISELESKVGSLGAEKEELHRIIAEKNEESQKLESFAKERIRAIETINLEKKELEQDNAELRQNISDLEIKAVEQMKAISELEGKVCGLASEKEELHRIIVEKNVESSKLESIAEERIRAIETINLEKEELEHVNAELRQNIFNLETKAVEQVKAISELESKVGSLGAEKEELHRIIAEKNEESPKLESIAKERIRAIETINVEKKELEHVNAELRQNISDLEIKAVEQMKAISELESKVGSLRSEKGELHRIIAENDEESLKLESIAKDRIHAIEIINLEKKELEHVNSQLLDKLSKLTTSKSELKDNDNLAQDKINLTMNEAITDNTDNQSFLSYSNQFNESTFETSALMLSMDVEKIQLEETLHLKSRELDEIKCDVHSLKQDIESLQKTIYLLTTENMEMANKLTAEHENAKQAEMNLQGTIDELYARISEVTNEKITLKSNLAALNDQMESMRTRVASPNVVSNEDDAFASYKAKIDKLTAENIELSATIAERNKEVEDIKESKSLLFDHECIYKEKTATVMERNKCLQTENNELSTDLMDKIEEIDELKEKCEILKKKLEQSLKSDETPSDNTTKDLQSENNVLKAEIIELKIKMTTLSEENTKFSNNLLQTIEELDSSRNEKILDDSVKSTCKEDIQGADHEALTLADKVETVQEKINRLTRLNKKLSDLKLTSCNQCIYLKNLNESRRALKLETKTLNQKFEDLQRKFARKCEDTEILKNMINQKLNTSGHELSPNASYVDDMDVTLVEERVQTLNDELQTLKTDHGKLTGLYEDKCNELEQLRSELSIDEESASNFTSMKRSEKNNCRVVHIQSHIDQLKADINDMRKNSTHFAATLNQMKNEKANLLNEIDGLRTSNEEMKQKLFMYENIAAGNIQVLESELTNMSKEVEQFFARERMLESQRLTLEMELEELKVDRDNKCALIESLKKDLLVANTNDDKYKEELKLLKKQREELEQQQNNLCKELQEKSIHVKQLYHQSEQEKFALMENLRTVEVELHNLTNNLEARYKNEIDTMSMQYQHRVEESENNIRLLNDTLDKYIDENLNLKQELNKLKSIEESTSCKEKALIGDIERLNEELNDIRLCMMKELRSLKCSINSAEISKQSVNKIFLILVQTLVSKEQEMIKTLRETYEEERRQLEDKIKQSADSEKRATTWSKELEGEIEKLQTELTEREHSQKEYENKITQLDHLFRECSRENEILRENTKTLEIDLHNLQTEYEKLYKTDNKQEEAIFEAQKRQKEVKEIFKSKELEFQSKLKTETDIYEKKINELSRDLDCSKLKNLEMSSVVEGLHVNEKKLKNIIEANTAQIKKSDQTIKIMKAELEQLTEAYNEASQQLDQKSVHIENISAILKSKCDSLTEYKTKLEAILPEYEMLKDHVGDQKATIERYRQEIEEFKIEREQQLETIKEKLKVEEIKNTGLSNQLNSRNVVMTKELNELKEKYEELQLENAKLKQKVRCSISNIRAEADIEELKEMNKRLQSNLEGANNRVAELQEIRNQTLTQLIDTKAMYDMLLQENTKIKTTLTSYETRYDASNKSTHESKFDELLLEKNAIALELEYKKLQLTQQEKEINEYVSQLQQLRDKNKELDEELEEYAVIIQERSVEISELESKLYSRFTENTRIVELEEKQNSLNEENRKLRDQIDALKMRLQMDMEDTSSDEDAKTRQNKNMIRILKRENLDLQSKLNSSKRQIDAKPSSSGTNISIQNTSIMDQSKDSNKKAPNDLEDAQIRLTKLKGEKYEIMKALTNSNRQCDNLSKENLEMKKILQLYKSKLDQPHSEARVGEELGDSIHDENKIACELESRTSELNQKECANKIRDLESRNKDLDIELGKCASIIHERDIEILKLKEILKIMREENNKLKSEIRELHNRSRSNKSINNCIEEFDYRLWNKISTNNESVKKQLQNSVVEENDKSKELKKKIHDLELQLVSKNGQLAALEIQIQSESFPYQRKCKELKEQLLAFRNKNTELNLEIQKLRKAVNDVNSWECDVCRRWRVNRKDQGCQTIPVKTVRFCSTNSGVVEDHVKIEKIEKEKRMLKELCRSRNRHIKELEMEIDRLKELMKT